MNSIIRTMTIIFITGVAVFVTSCNDDDTPEVIPMGIAFETTSLGIEENANTVTVNITFSEPAVTAGEITVNFEEKGVSYGTDYVTDPQANGSKMSIDVPVGSERVSFTVERIAEAISEGNSVIFNLEEFAGQENAQISGNTSVVVNFSAVAFAGAAFDAGVGGATQPNQLFVDLSLNNSVAAERVSWDLGFYNGTEDKVIVNYSTYGMAYKLEKTDITSVTSADTAGLSGVVTIGRAGADQFIDHPDGDLSRLAIADISSVDEENSVYIVNRGFGPGDGNPDPGTVDVGSQPRGWKKVRILKDSDGYLIRHADIDSETFTETIISKDAAYNFNYFNFDGTTPVVEPEAGDWDLVFTVSSNIIDFGAGDGAYGFSDFVKTNRVGGTMAALVELETDGDGNIVPGQTGYDDFEASDLSSVTLSENADVIGSGWRSVFTRSAVQSRFYIVEDPEGNIYKLRFTGLLNENGIRGNATFQYQLLQ